jgi:hypothetical protein
MCTQVRLHLLQATSSRRQLCRAPQLLVTRSHRLYLNLVVRREYLFPGRSGSTSTTPCSATTHLPVTRVLHQLHRAPRLLVSRLHGLYLNLVIRCCAARLFVGRTRRLAVRPVTESRGATTRRPDCTGANAPMPCIRTRRLAVRPVIASRGATTHRPDCTSSTAPMPCIRTRRLNARLLVSRSHWLSPCARSICCAS